MANIVLNGKLRCQSVYVFKNEDKNILIHLGNLDEENYILLTKVEAKRLLEALIKKLLEDVN